jgi:hypothetical protein
MDVISNQNYDSEYLAAGSNSTTEHRLSQLARSEKSMVRRRVAENMATPVGTLTRLILDAEPQVRIAAGLNRATPREVMVQLVYDEDPDVRYWLASAAYLPHRLLLELANDSNPYVAARANKSLTRLNENSSTCPVSIFDFFEVEHCLLALRLRRLIDASHTTFSGQIADEAIDTLCTLKEHFRKQQDFCISCIASDVQSEHLLARNSQDRRRIFEQADDLMRLHFASNDLSKRFSGLLRAVCLHSSFAEKELFHKVRSRTSAEEIEELNLRLNETLAAPPGVVGS